MREKPRQIAPGPPPVVTWDLPIAQPVPTPRSRVVPLKRAEAVRAEQVARRLRAELHSVVRALPEHARGASGMARCLDIDRSICQRIVTAIAYSDSDPELLGRAPGVRGLRTFLDSARRQLGSDSDLDGADAAIEQFESLIRETAGSQSRLIRRIRATRDTGDHEGAAAAKRDQEKAREMSFRAGVHLTGQCSDTNLVIWAVRPLASDPKRMEVAQVKGFIGHTARQDATPLVVLTGSRHDPEIDATGRYTTLAKDPARGRASGSVLEQFSTSPAPLVVTRGPMSGQVQIIDPQRTQDGEGKVDVVIANRQGEPSTHPAHEDPPIHEIWAFCRYPSRRMLFDVFLHRSMARACIPSLGAHLVSPNLADMIGQHWMDRLADSPHLQLLEQGLPSPESAFYPRYPELVTHFFDRLEWSRGEFVGYRCEVTFPIWGAGYCMAFDYRSGEDE